LSDCAKAFSGQAVTHLASSQNRQASAKLNIGVMRTTRILDLMGFQMFSPFSSVQAYSQMPHPVHLLGSTEMNFLDWNFEGGISLIRERLSYLNISVCSRVFSRGFFEVLRLCCSEKTIPPYIKAAV
jgi:hypothetical protein